MSRKKQEVFKVLRIKEFAKMDNFLMTCKV